MTKTTLTTLIAALVILLAATSFAGPGRNQTRGWNQGGPYHQNWGPNQLAPERQIQLEAILDKHELETRALRESMWQKELELQTLSVNPNTKPETLHALIGELSALRATMQEKHDALRAQIKQEIGIDYGTPCCWGQGRHGGMGYGRHGGMMGYGRHGGGMGYGHGMGYGPGMGHGGWHNR